MGTGDEARRYAKRIAAGASVALATSGLSSCNDNGAVDPPPPPLECNSLNMGQSLSATGTQSADTVEVTVRNTLGYATWRVDRVTAVEGATIVSTDLPGPIAPLEVVLRLDSETTTHAAFTVEATLLGGSGEQCAVERTFSVDITPGGVEVSLSDIDRLPLAARQKAEIMLAGHDGNVVELHARTPFRGERTIAWTVSDGELDSDDAPIVRWTLPPKAGLYRAELVIDYGNDGMALDQLLLEVVRSA